MFVDKPTTYGLETKNNKALQKLQEKSPILRKKTKKLLLKIEKKERRKLKRFHKLV